MGTESGGTSQDEFGAAQPRPSIIEVASKAADEAKKEMKGGPWASPSGTSLPEMGLNTLMAAVQTPEREARKAAAELVVGPGKFLLEAGRESAIRMAQGARGASDRLKALLGGGNS